MSLELSTMSAVHLNFWINIASLTGLTTVNYKKWNKQEQNWAEPGDTACINR